MFGTAVLLMCLVTGVSDSCDCGTSDGNPPKEVRPFIEPGTKPIFAMPTDLNGDELEDYIFITEDLLPSADVSGAEVFPRHMMLLVRDSEGELTERARNSEVVLDGQSGGMLGDPFQGIKTDAGQFTVILYGGNSMRWSYRYRFEYLGESDDWYLKQVEIDFYHVNENTLESLTYSAPDDFEALSFADFSADQWNAKGAEQ